MIVIGFATLIILLLIGTYIMKIKMFSAKFYIKSYEDKNKCKIIIFRDDILHNFYPNHVITIDHSDFFQIIYANLLHDNIKRIDLVMDTTGGSVESSDIIIKLLLSYRGEINVFIPYYAYSAGTLISLIGDKIYMNEYSMMSPTDPQVEFIDSEFTELVSVNSIIKLVKTKGIKNVSDTFGLQYFEYKKMYVENITTLRNIFMTKNKNNINKKNNNKYISHNAIKNIIKNLGSGNMSHHIPFLKDELIRMKLPVCNENVPETIMTILQKLS